MFLLPGLWRESHHLPLPLWIVLFTCSASLPNTCIFLLFAKLLYYYSFRALDFGFIFHVFRMYHWHYLTFVQSKFCLNTHRKFMNYFWHILSLSNHNFLLASLPFPQSSFFLFLSLILFIFQLFPTILFIFHSFIPYHFFKVFKSLLFLISSSFFHSSTILFSFVSTKAQPLKFPIFTPLRSLYISAFSFQSNLFSITTYVNLNFLLLVSLDTPTPIHQIQSKRHVSCMEKKFPFCDVEWLFNFLNLSISISIQIS